MRRIAYIWHSREKTLEKIFYESPFKKMFDKYLRKRRPAVDPDNRPVLKPFAGWRDKQ